MDYVDRMSSWASGSAPSHRRVSFDSFFKFTDISPNVQLFLRQVYTVLAMTIAVAALGVYTNMVTGFGDFLGMFAFIILVPWLLATPPTLQNQTRRAAMLGGAAFSNGLIMGPLVGTILDIYPGVVLTAFLGTSLIFACFSGAALFARRRSYLFLGGILSSVISGLMMMRMMTWFMGGRGMLFEAELYMGGLVFLGYVMFDTQMLVERAEQTGDRDAIRGALELFIDFGALFVRLLIILARNAGNGRSDEEDKRRRGSSLRRRRA